MNKEAIEVAIAANAPKATTAGVGLLGFGWLTADQLATWIGVTAAVLGSIATIYFKRRTDKREQAEYERKRELDELRRDWLRAKINAGLPIAPDDFAGTDHAALDERLGRYE